MFVFLDWVHDKDFNPTTKPGNELDTSGLQSESLSLLTPSLFLPETNIFISRNQTSTQSDTALQSRDDWESLNISADTKESDQTAARHKTPKYQRHDPSRKRTRAEARFSQLSVEELKISNIEETSDEDNQARSLCEEKIENISAENAPSTLENIPGTPENVPGTSQKQCPCCFGNFDKYNQVQFEGHVLECLENQLYKDSKPRDSEITGEELRTCPICNMEVPYEMGQTEYELHVLRHIEVSDMEYDEIHYRETEQLSVS